jgi:sulfur carrier protein
MIEISLNGQVREFDEHLPLLQALIEWGYRCEKVAVAINSEFVPRADYEKTFLRDDDAIDVVLPVQGG